MVVHGHGHVTKLLGRGFKFYTELTMDKCNKIYTWDSPQVAVVSVTWPNLKFYILLIISAPLKNKQF